MVGPRPVRTSRNHNETAAVRDTARSDSTESDGSPNNGPLQSHKDRLRAFDMPPSPGVLGQLIKDFDGGAGQAGPAIHSHAQHGRAGVPQSPLKALLKQHFGPNKSSEEVQHIPGPSGGRFRIAEDDVVPWQHG